jgi:hypothetical protein
MYDLAFNLFNGHNHPARFENNGITRLHYDGLLLVALAR